MNKQFKILEDLLFAIIGTHANTYKHLKKLKKQGCTDYTQQPENFEKFELAVNKHLIKLEDEYDSEDLTDLIEEVSNFLDHNNCPTDFINNDPISYENYFFGKVIFISDWHSQSFYLMHLCRCEIYRHMENRQQYNLNSLQGIYQNVSRIFKRQSNGI